LDWPGRVHVARRHKGRNARRGTAAASGSARFPAVIEVTGGFLLFDPSRHSALVIDLREGGSLIVDATHAPHRLRRRPRQPADRIASRPLSPRWRADRPINPGAAAGS